MIKNILKNRILLHEKFRADINRPIEELIHNKSDLEFLQKLEKLIEKNIDSNDFSANFISKYLGMSHSVIYKKLKIITGMSLIEYIRDYKLNKAKQLLETKRYTITEVCYQIGYSDRKYFSKLFKERFGKSPSFYLKENK